MKNMLFIPKLREQNDSYPWLAPCMMLLLHCRAYSRVCCSLKLIWVYDKLLQSDPVQVEYNRVGP